jgi:hypothetical protein
MNKCQIIINGSLCNKYTKNYRCNKCDCSMCPEHTYLPNIQINNDKSLISIDDFNNKCVYGYNKKGYEYRWVCSNCNDN